MPLSEFTYRRRVTFPEVDSAGIVHFSNYFRYMEEAEHALWRAAGLSVAKRGTGVGFPRVSASFDYHRPLRFEDEFDARIRIVALREKSFRYECTLTKGDEKIATGTVTVVCVARGPDGGMKACPIPPEIVAHFEASPEAGA
jgi:YbgC/YbaW family acyl-CoA thioester hydrolase